MRTPPDRTSTAASKPLNTQSAAEPAGLTGETYGGVFSAGFTTLTSPPSSHMEVNIHKEKRMMRSRI